MYQPDRVFLDKLKRLDKRLGCDFRKHLGEDGLFVITFDRGYKAPAMVLTIKTEDGKFRFPDERDIETLHNGDMENPKVREEVYQMADYYARMREARDKCEADDIRHGIIESRRQLLPLFARMYNAGGKNNSTFRRIEPKAKGKVFR